jgi:hypothetical protein
MPRFYNISANEMADLLTPQGFRLMNLPGTTELVYGKVVDHGKHKLSIRVYTAIWPSGESRERGADAIRVQVYIMYDNTPTKIGKTRNVKRIETWAKNVQAAIDEWTENYKVCPACGWPMVSRNGQHGEFWGCITYHKTKCNGRKKPECAAPTPAPTAVASPAPSGGGSSLWDKLMKKPDHKTIRKVVAVVNAVPPAPPPVVVAPPFSGKEKADPNDRRWEFPGDPLNEYRIPTWKISAEQQSAVVAYRTKSCNLMLPSRAGGGKTALLRHLSSFREGSQRLTYQAFNSKNAAEARKKMPRGTWSMTTHSHLLRVLRDHIKGMPERAQDNKTWLVMEEVYPSMNKKDRKRIRRAAFKLTGLSKNFAVRPGDIDGIKAVMDRYSFDLETDNEINTAVEVVNEVLQLSRPSAKFGNIFDCDDMLWWWVILDLPPQFYHVALLDEVQDFNQCQLEMVRRMLHKGTRVIAVGDPFQAVYRFRGADSEAYNLLGEILAGDKRGCETILLPTNYRCGKKIIEWVRENTIVKDIVAAPDAIEGEVNEALSYDGLIEMLAEEFMPMAA